MEYWQLFIGFVTGLLFYRFILDKADVIIRGKLKQKGSDLTSNITIPKKPKFWKFRKSRKRKN